MSKNQRVYRTSRRIKGSIERQSLGHGFLHQPYLKGNRINPLFAHIRLRMSDHSDIALPSATVLLKRGGGTVRIQTLREAIDRLHASDVSDTAPFDGHPLVRTDEAGKRSSTGCTCPTSRTWPPPTAIPPGGGTPSAPKQQETPSIGCTCPTSRTWPPSTAVARRWGDGPLSHSTNPAHYRIQLSHSNISDTSGTAFFGAINGQPGGARSEDRSNLLR